MITAEQIAKLLKKPQKKSDGSWMACCPAHDDRNPSLSIRDGDDDKLLLFCHAGCEYGNITAAIEHQHAIKLGNTGGRNGDVPRLKAPANWPSTYRYYDENGVERYLVHRLYQKNGDKTFRQMRSDGRGGYIKNMDGVERLPYRLPYWKELDSVVVVEGEKDVDALAKYGVAATCNPGGAGNWKPELNRWFAGKMVFIIPDNDDPGRKHAQKVAGQLEGIAAATTISDLCAGMKAKADVTDYIVEHRGPNSHTLWQAIIGSPPPTFFDPIDPWAQFSVPAVPLELLPPIVANAVMDRHERTGADLSGVAMCALSALGSAISAENTIKPRRNDDYWLERPVLWTLLCGDPSSMKTPTINWAFGGLKELQKERVTTHKELFDLWEEDGTDIQGDEPKAPPLLHTNDATYESVVEILAQQNRGITMHRDEFSGFIGSLDRYTAARGASAERAFYLTAWSGGGYQSNRKSGSAFVENLSVDFIGGIQPEKLREMKDLSADGLLQRFLPVIMDKAKLSRDIPARSSADYYELTRELAELEPQDYTICEEGHLILDELFEKLHFLETSDIFGSTFSAFIGKMRGYSARLALVLHCADESERQQNGNVVGPGPVRKASDFILKVIIPHGTAFYNDIIGATGSENIKSIAGYILTKKSPDNPRVVTSDLNSNVRCCRNRDTRAIMEMLGPLVAGGWLEPEKPFPSNNAWLVNTGVFAKFEERRAMEAKRRKEVREVILAAGEARRENKECLDQGIS